MQNLQALPDRDESTPTHRIGGVSRLAGVPAATLRVWESRHGAFTPAKSGGRHRLYTQEDAVRARLLRQLTESGHSIAGIARLPLQQLQSLLVESRSADGRADAAAASRRVRAVIVGAALAARVNAPQWRFRDAGDVLEIPRVYLDQGEAVDDETSTPAADMLLVRLNAVVPGTRERIEALAARIRSRHVVVLYNFAAAPSLAQLRAAGWMLRREPVDDAELGELIRSSTYVDTQEAIRSGGGAALPPRRCSAAVLARIATSPSHVLCECPRHLADIITQQASFEEYSAHCLNESEEDAQLHARLRSVAGTARALFEQALADAASHAGLALAE
jgi:DNA-binding transcriptional MerR regulator